MKSAETTTDPLPPKQYVDAWTKVLNEMGPETVRMRLSSGEVRPFPNVFVKFARVRINNRSITPKRHFVDQWLADEDKKSRRRASVQNMLIWIGALAAVIGAITGLFSILEFKQ